MKYFKKVFLWISISLIFQMIIFYLADRYIMIKEDVRIYKMNFKEKAEVEKINIGMKCKPSWKNIQCSYDGRYISYIEGDNLFVYNSITKDRKQIPFDGNHTLAYHMWIPQRERMIIIEKSLNGKDSIFSISYYDADLTEKKNVQEISHEEKEAYVQDVEVSLLTGIIYINVVSNNVKSNLYRIDISENVTAIDTENYFIDKLSLVESMDRLIYEDKLYNKIFYVDFPSNEGEEINIRGSEEEESEDGQEQLNENMENNEQANDKDESQKQDHKGRQDNIIGTEKLLGSNDLGEVYIGILNEGHIEDIYISNGDIELKSWRVKKLDKAITQENIFVCEDGGFYVSYPEDKKVIYYNGSNKIERELKGRVIGYYEKGFIYMDEEYNLIGEEILE